MRLYELLTEYTISEFAKKGVAEGLEDYEGIKIKFSKDSDGVAVKALSDDGNKVLASVELFFNEKGQLEPQDLWTNDRYQGQGIAKAMYDFLKNKGYTIIRSWDQTDAGKGFWDKHKGNEVNVWEQGVAESTLGHVISWPEVVNKINSAMKATGWKGQRQSDDAFMFSTKGQLDDEFYMAIIENAGDGFFTYALGTVEEGDPYIDDAYKGKLPNTEASVSELLNIIRDGYGLNEATYKGREVNLGVPVKHVEHFFVYQKDPITLRVKKIILKDPTKKIKQIKHRRRRH